MPDAGRVSIMPDRGSILSGDTSPMKSARNRRPGRPRGANVSFQWEKRRLSAPGLREECPI